MPPRVDDLDPAARSLLAEGRQLHVGVLTTTGPHVTPELYSFDDKHVWFLTAADTLKTRVVRRDPRVAAVVRIGSRSLLLSGTITDYDIREPRKLLMQARDALAALAALTSFTVRNATDLAAFARDLAAGRLPSRLPPRRVLMRLAPERGLLLDDTALLATDGAWPGRVTVPDEAPPLVGAVDCVVGVDGPEGVLVLPGRAEESLTSATVPAVAVQIADLPTDRELAGCLVVDDYRGPGPAAKRGELLRGRVRFDIDDASCRVHLDADRDTTWAGAASATRAT
jgi:hypothetical protein